MDTNSNPTEVAGASAVLIAKHPSLRDLGNPDSAPPKMPRRKSTGSIRLASPEDDTEYYYCSDDGDSDDDGEYYDDGDDSDDDSSESSFSGDGDDNVDYEKVTKVGTDGAREKTPNHQTTSLHSSPPVCMSDREHDNLPKSPDPCKEKFQQQLSGNTFVDSTNDVLRGDDASADSNNNNDGGRRNRTKSTSLPLNRSTSSHKLQFLRKNARPLINKAA